MKNTIQNYLDENEIHNRTLSNQGKLAEMVGVRREYINRIINDKITPTVPLAIRIARALGCRVEDVFVLGEEG
jgi:putative transcriptional regulator